MEGWDFIRESLEKWEQQPLTSKRGGENIVSTMGYIQIKLFNTKILSE